MISDSATMTKSLEAIGRQMGLPLHEQVRRHLRLLIESQFKDGQRFFSERELIERLGLSQPTIRRALSELAGEGLLNRGVGKGTFVRKTIRDRSVGIFLPMLDSPLQLAVIKTLAKLCAEKDFGFHLYNIRPTSTIKEICDSIHRSPREERILFHSTTTDSWDLYHEFDKRGYRSVFMSGILPNFPGNCVEKDARAAVNLMLDHFVSLGHKRIAFLVNEPTSLVSIRERLRLIKLGIEERGLIDSIIIDGHAQAWDDSFAVAYGKMDEIMALEPRPTALCPLSAAGTWAALRYLTKHRIRVPEQLSLISFDDLPSGDMIYPALTSISYSPNLEIAALDLLWGESTRYSTEVILPRLIVRESTGPAPS